jgi:uncharacterized protein (TIGR00369 family)
MTDPFGDAPPLDPAIAARIRDSFTRQSLMDTLGARLDALAPGLCRIAAPILPGSLQQHGYGHAGLTFSIADSAAGYAALSLMGLGEEVLTVELKINLLAPARGDLLLATGRVVKAGRKLVIVQADVHAQRGTDLVHIALLQGTMIPA